MNNGIVDGTRDATPAGTRLTPNTSNPLYIVVIENPTTKMRAKSSRRVEELFAPNQRQPDQEETADHRAHEGEQEPRGVVRIRASGVDATGDAMRRVTQDGRRARPRAADRR